MQFSLGFERQLAKKTTLAVNYVGTRGVQQFRSRDANAPLPPGFAPGPTPPSTSLREIESAGRVEGNALEVTLRGDIAPARHRHGPVRLRPDHDRHGRRELVPGEQLCARRRMGPGRHRPPASVQLPGNRIASPVGELRVCRSRCCPAFRSTSPPAATTTATAWHWTGPSASRATPASVPALAIDRPALVPRLPLPARRKRTRARRLRSRSMHSTC